MRTVLTVADFEKNITDALESHTTQVSNDRDYYRNDTDDSDMAELLRTEFHLVI